MHKILVLILLSLFVSCNKTAPKDCAAASGAQKETTPNTDCTITDEKPLEPSDTTGGTDGGATTGGTDGGTTTGGTDGGTTTGGTDGGTTTGGTDGGTTTGGTTGGTTTGGTTGGSTTGGSTTGGTTDDLPEAALTWDADILFVNFNATQEAKVQKAVELMKKVIATKTFRDRVLNFTYNGQKTFVDNGGYTNAQIYQKILDGAEKMGDTSKNNTLNVELELYTNSLTSTIGYTYPDTTRIWMNTKYFNTYTAVNVSDNLTHEWLHKLGFGHASSYSVSRDSSVPYAIGYLMEELAGKIK